MRALIILALLWAPAAFAQSVGSRAPAQVYVGPGDVVSGAKAWYGMRAYSAASAGRAAIRIQRASDSTQTDVGTLANGHFDTATASTFCTATSCTVVTIYDQTGNGFDATCSGCDAIQIPTLKFNCTPKGDPCWDIAGAAVDNSGTHGYISAQTFTSSVNASLTAVYNDYAINKGALARSYLANMDTMFTYTDNKPDLTTISAPRPSGGQCYNHNCYLMEIFCGTGGPLKTETQVAVSTWHYALGYCNGAASLVSLDGEEVVGQGGSATYTPSSMHLNYMSAEVSRLTVEAGYWDNLLFSAGQRAAMNLNMRQFWGF